MILCRENKNDEELPELAFRSTDTLYLLKLTLTIKFDNKTTVDSLPGDHLLQNIGRELHPAPVGRNCADQLGRALVKPQLFIRRDGKIHNNTWITHTSDPASVSPKATAPVKRRGIAQH